MCSNSSFSICAGTKGTNMCFVPIKLTCFKNSTTSWVDFSGGQHHTLCLDAEGKLPLRECRTTQVMAENSQVTQGNNKCLKCIGKTVALRSFILSSDLSKVQSPFFLILSFRAGLQPGQSRIWSPWFGTRC